MGDGRVMVDKGHQPRAGVGPGAVYLLVALLDKATHSLPHSAWGEGKGGHVTVT